MKLLTKAPSKAVAKVVTPAVGDYYTDTIRLVEVRAIVGDMLIVHNCSDPVEDAVFKLPIKNMHPPLWERLDRAA